MERGGAAARRYHHRTKHSPESVRSVPHFLDWDNQPLPFKIYRNPFRLSLPEVPGASGMAALEALERNLPWNESAGLDLEKLSRLLFYAGGITKDLAFSGGRMAFRAAACTGALYHIEIYLACGALPGLEAGLYHYDPRDHGLDRLRTGDWRSLLVKATGGERHASEAGALFILTTTYWRNAWKYRERAYRHAFWDGGTMLANLLAMGSALSVPLHLLLGFADDEVHRLLDVDARKESAVALVAASSPGGAPPGAPGEPVELGLQTVPLSTEEVTYSAIQEMQRESSLSSGEEAKEWRESAPPVSTTHRGEPGPVRALRSLASRERPAISLEQVIRKRGSARRFERTSIGERELATILGCAIRPVKGDVFPPDDVVCDPYLIANAVSDLASGAYALYPGRGLLPLQEGNLRERARFLDLEQDLAGDAASNLYLLASLPAILERWGSRGYRIAQLEGGILGGRIYLAAYALGLGATGLTFYDDAVTDFFSPHASEKSVMFLAALGVPARRPVLYQK